MEWVVWLFDFYISCNIVGWRRKTYCNESQTNIFTAADVWSRMKQSGDEVNAWKAAADKANGWNGGD